MGRKGISNPNSIEVITADYYILGKKKVGLKVTGNVPVSLIEEYLKETKTSCFVINTYNESIVNKFGLPLLKIKNFYFFNKVNTDVLVAIISEQIELEKLHDRPGVLAYLDGIELPTDNYGDYIGSRKLINAYEHQQKIIVYKNWIRALEFSYSRNALHLNYRSYRELSPMEIMVDAVEINGNIIPLNKLKVD